MDLAQTPSTKGASRETYRTTTGPDHANRPDHRRPNHRLRAAAAAAKARKKCRRPHPEQLALCAWNRYATEVPAEKLRRAEALVLARCRWQVEQWFKRWKSQGQIDQSPSAKPYRVLCEGYGKLRAMVVQHGVTLLSWGAAVGQGVRKAARKVRQQALQLASVLRVPAQLRRVLRRGL